MLQQVPEFAGSSIAVLAVVLIRTFLSFALQVEMDGRLPWRRA